MAQQRLGRIKRELQFGLRLDGIPEELFFKVLDRQVLGVDDGRRQTQDGASAMEFAVGEKTASGFSEELEPRIGVVADFRGDLGAGGGEKFEIVAFGLDLGEAKRARAEIDADRVRGGSEDVLDESEHIWIRALLWVRIDGCRSDGDGMQEFGGDGIGDGQAALR